MTFTEGNALVRDHKSRGKRIFYFKEVRKSHLEFQGELELIGWEEEETRDLSWEMRKAIKFHLKRVGEKYRMR